MLKILITTPAGEARKYALPAEEGAQYVLGRAEDCDIALTDDGSLSRYHALILHEEGRWCIRDNNSVNGVRLGEVPVLFTAMVPRSVFRIGNTTLEVLDTAAAASAPTPAPLPPAEVPAEEPEPALEAPAEPEPAAEQEPAPEQAPELTTEPTLEAAPEPEPIPEPAAPPVPLPELKPVAERLAPRRLAQREKPAPRALKNSRGESVERQAGATAAAKPAPRAMRRAGGSRINGERGKQRRVRALETVEMPTGVSGEFWGLPHDFDVNLWLAEPRHAVTDGSVLRFGVESAADAEVFLVQHDSMGDVCLLIPSAPAAGAKLTAQKAVALPPKGFLASDELVASAPYGTDTVVAVVCTASLPFAATLQALLAEENIDKRAGRLESEAINRLRTAHPDTPALWSSAVIRIETKA